MNVSVAEDENTYTSITTAAWPHPWPQRRCSVSLCLVRERFDEKTDNTHVQYLSLQVLFFVDEQNNIYRVMKNTFCALSSPLYSNTSTDIYTVCSLSMSIYYLWVSHSCNSKYYLFLLSTSTAQLSSAMVLAQLGHLVGLLLLVPGYKQRSGINLLISVCPTLQRAVVICSRIAC